MNILIIDDHQFLKEGIESRIKQVLPDANCVFITNVRGAVNKVVEEKIDLVFCDLEFDNDPNYDGFDFVKNIQESGLPVKVIALTNYNSYRVMNKVRKSGFSSFLLKTCPFHEFSETLLSVRDNEGEYISFSMKTILKKRYESLKSLFSDSLYGIINLSDNELELVIHSAKLTNRKELAERMSKSPYTIDSYYKSILDKLSLKSRIEVQLFANEFMDELIKRKNQGMGN